MAKQEITKRQKNIQQLVFTFRFINSKQIQKFLGHKDHRRINGWLKDLSDREYLVRNYTQRFGTSTKPAVFNLASKGRKVIRKTYPYASEVYLKRIVDDKDRSKAFRIKCQVVADFFLILFSDRNKAFIKDINTQLIQGVKLHKNELQFFTPAFYEGLNSVLLPQLKPDGYIYKYQSSKGETHMFLYVLDAYIPRIMLRYFVQNIFTTLNEESWESDDIISLQFYLVCPNNMVIIYLKKLIPSFLENYWGNAELSFHFSTRNKLYKRQKTKSTSTGWITISSKDEFD